MNMQRRKIDYQMLVGYLLCTAGLMLGSWLSFGIFKSLETNDWPGTEGMVYHSEIQTGTTNPVDQNATYNQVLVHYRYRVANTAYENTNIYRNDAPMLSEAQAKQLAAAFPIGSVQSIYYNPNNPAESVLIQGISTTLLYLLAPSLLFVAVGFSTIKKRGRSR